MNGMRTVIASVVTLVVVPLAFGASVSGDVRGVIRNSLGMPVPGQTLLSTAGMKPAIAPW